MASCVEQVSLETVAFMELAVHQCLSVSHSRMAVGEAIFSCMVEVDSYVAIATFSFGRRHLPWIALKFLLVCVIVEDGEVIASGRNRTTETRNATRHAEMEAIDVLLEKWKQNGLSEAEVANKFSKCTLYVTCEPCIMCAAALSILGMLILVHVMKVGGVPRQKGFKCTGGIMASEAVSLLRSFYEQGNPNELQSHIDHQCRRYEAICVLHQRGVWWQRKLQTSIDDALLLEAHF
ncbi:unnamed protein product [Camellia sinensis]